MSELMTEVSPDFENTVMELLMFSGGARSSALMALQRARAGDFTAAARHMAESKQSMKKAHLIQTRLIGLDEGCGKLTINLITVHVQDHLMNAMVIQDLADDMIELYCRQALLEVRA